ncbi:hypothetical protein, partial [Deinococcus soli (ex Cha et al. 2016)]|uniref:hypothetical protein n=1 Tax=Deinococcus soli (ex Cha et al. 2016) TaxID=1309411 RepID=UPI001E65CDB7
FLDHVLHGIDFQALLPDYFQQAGVLFLELAKRPSPARVLFWPRRRLASPTVVSPYFFQA